MTPSQVRDIHEDILRLDFRPRPADNVTLRYIRDRVEQIEPDGSFGGTAGYDLVPTSQAVVAEEVVEAAVEVALAALGDDVDLRAAGPAELRRVDAGHHAELLDRVDRDVVDLRGVGAGVEVLAAVEGDGGEVFAEAVHLLRVGADARAELVAALVTAMAGNVRVTVAPGSTIPSHEANRGAGSGMAGPVSAVGAGRLGPPKLISIANNIDTD